MSHAHKRGGEAQVKAHIMNPMKRAHTDTPRHNSPYRTPNHLASWSTADTAHTKAQNALKHSQVSVEARGDILLSQNMR